MAMVCATSPKTWPERVGREVPSASLDQKTGVVALGVQGVGGDDGIEQVQRPQQRFERRQLAGLAVDLDLGHHRAVLAGAGGEQVPSPARGGVVAGSELWCELQGSGVVEVTAGTPRPGP